MKLLFFIFGLLGLIALAKAGGLNVCEMPSAEGGPDEYCRAAHQKYFFNKDTKQCETFTYGGCGGNQNRFDTKDECEKACKPQ